MKLFLAGGVGEHGRSCFLVQGAPLCFLVDCGAMAGSPQPYPRLSAEQIRSVRYVFLTHSHADHTGALPWLLEQGFRGQVIATAETLSQLPFSLPDPLPLEQFCPPEGLRLDWGRSGHCAGSVWYLFRLEGRAILFSGDYTESSCVYAADPIRRIRADAGILDCAYGRSEASPETLQFDLLTELSRLISAGKPVLLPVPKYGRGPELLYLLHCAKPQTPVFGDAHFLAQLKWLRSDRFWCMPHAREVLSRSPVQPLQEVPEAGICFVSDPQLKAEGSRRLAQAVLARGGSLVMTGTPEAGSCSEALLQKGAMTFLRYPVHQNETEYKALLHKNQIFRAIAYHTPQFSAKPEILI